LGTRLQGRTLAALPQYEELAVEMELWKLIMPY